MDEKGDGDFLLLAHRIDGLGLVPYHRIEVSKQAEKLRVIQSLTYLMICLSPRLKKWIPVLSVTDPDPGSGTQCFFYPGIQIWETGSGINILDQISETLV